MLIFKVFVTALYYVFEKATVKRSLFESKESIKIPVSQNLYFRGKKLYISSNDLSFSSRATYEGRRKIICNT